MIRKGVKLFHLVKGIPLNLGDKITAKDCGGFVIEDIDYIRLNKNMDVTDFKNDLISSFNFKGESYHNDVMYITNESNTIIGVIPINYKEQNK